MRSFKDLLVEGIIESTTRKKDTTGLIKYLRDDEPVTPELKTFLADVLEEGKLKPKEQTPKRLLRNKTGQFLIKTYFKYYLDLLQSDDKDEWEWIKAKLEAAEITPDIDSKGGRSKTLKKLLMCEYNLTSSEFDAIYNLRKPREKKG